MSEMAVTFLVLGATMVLFLWSRFSPDIVAMASLMALFLTGVIDLGEALSGFANATVLLIAALFVVGEGLTRTGITAWVGEQLVERSRGSERRLLVLAMLATAVLSGFISNTGTVAALTPAVVAAAWGMRSIPAAFLIPVAFAANAGGLLTLAGSPPNIIVDEALAGAGFGGFGFFEYALVGGPIVLVAVGYMATVGRRLLPTERAGAAPPRMDAEIEALAEAYELEGGLYRMTVEEGSPLLGLSLRDLDLGRRTGITVLRIDRDERRGPIGETAGVVREAIRSPRGDSLPDPDLALAVGDVLTINGSDEQISHLGAGMQAAAQPLVHVDEHLRDMLTRRDGVAEVLLTPRSSYIGRRISEGVIGRGYGVLVLGIRRGEKQLEKTEPLRFGDALLVQGPWERIDAMAEEKRNFVVVGRPDEISTQVTQLTPKSWVALGITAGMVALMVTGWVPTVVAALLAAGAMLLTRCLTTQQGYRSITLSTVILIAAMIPMAIALTDTGGAQLIADGLVATLGGLGPVWLLAAVFLVTTGLSQVISNTATTVLMAPIVLSAAAGLGVSPLPLMMSVAVGAAAAFLTPIGTAPNLMVMSTGGYRFGDYLKVGAPLLVLVLALSVALIPLVWPF